MQHVFGGHHAGNSLHDITSGTRVIGHRLWLYVLWGFLFLVVLLSSCSRKSGKEASGVERPLASATMRNDTALQNRTVEQLLLDYERQSGRKRLSTANHLLGRFHQEKLTDSLILVTETMNPESVNLLVWYWSGEYFFAVQKYDECQRYAKKALPLAYKGHDRILLSDCEHLVGLSYFRQSDYAQALEHVKKGLELDREMDDKGRVSSSLNTLAGISLVAKDLKHAEKYVKEALAFSTGMHDSVRIAIQYGMASEIYYAMGKYHLALDNSQRAYTLDYELNNMPKVGIRLSQMASAQKALGQDKAAEESLKRAMPILAKAGNETSLAICHNQMGELLNRRGEKAEAVEHFKQAVNTFAARNDRYNESRAQMGLYEALKDADPREADVHLRRYAVLKDSIYKSELEQAVSRYNVKFKTDELAFQYKRERIEKRSVIIVTLLLVAILLFIVMTLVSRSRVRKKGYLMRKQMIKMRERFFTNITHEFRTPLTLIIGLSRDLKADVGCSDEAKKKAVTIERQGTNLLALINQLLDIAKVNSEVGNVKWRNGDVTAYVMMIIESYRNYTQHRHIELQFIPKESVVMDFVPDYMNKLMNNLLSNAIKFTPDYGRVGVTMWKMDERLCIDVIDTGEGMNQETLAHIYDPFYQADNDSKNIGTGIGLALVKQIIDTLEGTIEVKSEISKGTSFHITLPIYNKVKQQVEADAAGTPSVSLQNENILTDTDDGRYDYRVLVIEDNKDVAAYIGDKLSNHYAIYYATDGKEGWEKALAIVPDLIITDWMMPEMDGLELCRQVRNNEVINHVPIIVITAKIAGEDRIKCLEAGADAYIVKPFNADELRARVGQLIGSRQLLREKYAAAVDEMNVEEKGATASGPNDADMHFLTRVVDAVCLLLSRSKETSVTTVASMMCMSNSQFYRKIVAITGYTPTAYIQRVKINKAKKLINDNATMGLSEVATYCGFDTYSNFSRVFKNVCGVSPKEYRKRLNLPTDNA